MPGNFVKRLQTIDRLIQKKLTETSIQLAKKLEISERTAKEYIMDIKEFGAPVYFNRAANSYSFKTKAFLTFLLLSCNEVARWINNFAVIKVDETLGRLHHRLVAGQ